MTNWTGLNVTLMLQHLITLNELCCYALDRAVQRTGIVVRQVQMYRLTGRLNRQPHQSVRTLDSQVSEPLGTIYGGKIEQLCVICLSSRLPRIPQ